MGKEEKAESSEGSSGIERARLDALKARERFQKACRAIDPMSYVRKNPLTSAGGAFALGFGLSALSRQIALIQVVPLLLQSAETAMSLLCYMRKK